MRKTIPFLLALVLSSCGAATNRPNSVPDAGNTPQTHQDGPGATILDAAPDSPVAPPDAFVDVPCAMDASVSDVRSACKDVIYALCEVISGCGLEDMATCVGDLRMRVCAQATGLRNACEIPACLRYLRNLSCAELESPDFAIDPNCYHQFIEG